MAESRIQKSLLNAKVNLIFYALTLALSFFSRKIFLNCLGADFVGLTETLQNVLGFLNLAELGIGAAIGYVLYKPLFDKDQPKITEIISVFGYLYSRIGYLILAGGILLSCFLPLIFPKTGFQWGVIYFAFYAFLFSSLIGYFCNYKQTLLGADQKNYVVTAYFQSANILKTVIQMGSAWYTGSFYLWIIIEVIFGITYSIILNWKMKQVYPWLASEVLLGRTLFKKYPEVMKYTKQIFIHKMGSFIQWQTTPFIIYSFSTLQLVAYFGNYSMIFSKASNLLNQILDSSQSGIGNLIAEGNMKKIKKVFYEILALRIFLGGITSFSLYLTVTPFIELWLGEKYILSSSILILITIRSYFVYTFGATSQFCFGFGLFWDTWIPLLEILIFLAVAIFGGYMWGLPGILLGGVISYGLIYGVWKAYLVYRWGFRDNAFHYWWKYIFLTSILFIVAQFTIWQVNIIIPIIANSASSSFYNLCIYSLLTIPSYSLLVLLIFYFTNSGTRSLLQRLIRKKL